MIKGIGDFMAVIKGLFAFVLFFALVTGPQLHAAGSLGGSGIGGISNRLPPHVGVGTSPRAWNGDSLDVGDYSSISSDTIYSYFAGNVYKRASDNAWIYKTDGRASVISMHKSGGTITFQSAPTGVAGNVATLTTTMTMNSLNNVQFYGSVSSSKACATNFVRVTPNYCVRDTDAPLVTLDYNACTIIPHPSGSSGITALVVRTYAYAISANVANTQRFATVTQHFGGSCAGDGNVLVDARGHEFTATLGVGVGSDSRESTVVVSGGPLIKLSRDVGTLSTAQYAVVGYYD